MILFWMVIGVMTLIAVGFVAYPLLKVGATRVGVVLFILLAFAMTGVSLGIYWRQGNSRGYEEQVLINRLKHQLAVAPHSAKGWYLLGRLYIDTGQYREGKRAMQRALKVRGRHQK